VEKIDEEMMDRNGETEKRRNGDKKAVINIADSPVPPFPVSKDSGTFSSGFMESREIRWAAI
jgi:hypothetical protein